MTNRKFYRTVIEVEVLSEEPIEGYSFETLLHQITEGDWSGKSKITVSETLDGKQAAKAFRNQASDPCFFNLTPEGEDAEL